MESSRCSPPSLFELCKRLWYQIISDTAKRQSKELNDTITWGHFNSNRERSLQQTFEDFNIDNADNTKLDINGNNTSKPLNNLMRTSYPKRYYVPTDLVNEYFKYLPQFIKKDLCNGPISRCDNIECRRPIFDYVFYEFCFG